MGKLTILDVRSFDPRYRHALIFSMFEGLVAGASFELVNDHDPVPLREQFQSLSLPNFGWSYLEMGPSIWRVRIAKTGPNAEAHGCGACKDE